MNRFNYVGPAAQAISLVGGLATAGGQLMKTEQNTKAIAKGIDKAIKVSGNQNFNTIPLSPSMKSKMDFMDDPNGESKLAEGLKNSGHQSVNDFHHERMANAQAQKSMNDYKAKSRQPQLMYNTFKDTSYPDLSTIRNEGQEV